MNMLRKQGDISAQRPMPSAVLNDASLVTSVSGETLQFFYYNAGVLTQDAGQVAGSLIVAKLAYAPILDDVGSKVANNDNKSLSFTSLALTNEREWDWTRLEQSFDTSGATLLETITRDFENGDYVIDYQTGTLYAKKATTAVTATSVAYKVPGKTPIAVTLDASDVQIGAVEIKDEGSNTRAKVSASGADAVTNTQTQIEVGSRLSAFNGTTWDRIRSGLVAVQTTFVGLLNALSMGRYNATPPTLADGNVAIQQMDARGNTKVALADGVNQVAVTTAGADAVSNTQNNISAQARNYGFNGSTWDRIRTAITGATSTITGILSTIGLGVYNTTRPAATNGQVVGFQTDTEGKQITLPYTRPADMVSGTTAAMTGTTSTSLVAAPGAGLRNYITTIIVSNSHSSVGTDVVIQDGNGGTTLLTIPAAAIYGGAVITLPTPLKQPSTATALFCANVTTGASTKVSAVGYIGA